MTQSNFLSPVWHQPSPQAKLFCGQKITAISLNVLVLLGLIPFAIKPASAQNILGCQAVIGDTVDIKNSGVISYGDRPGDNSRSLNTPVNTTIIKGLNEADQSIKLSGIGVTDDQGNTVAGLGAIAKDLIDLFQQQGLNQEEANNASLKTISSLADVSLQASATEIAQVVKQSSAKEVTDPSSQELIEQIPDSALLAALAGLQSSNLTALGLNSAEVDAAKDTEISLEAETPFIDQIVSVSEATAEIVSRPEAETQISVAQERYQQDLASVKAGEQSGIAPGSTLQFKFRLDNQENKVTEVQLPNSNQITENGLAGSGEVTGVIYSLVSNEGQAESQNVTQASTKVAIPAGQSLELDVEVEVGAMPDTEVSALEVNLQTDCGNPVIQSASLLPSISPDENPDSNLIDPLGQITGCAGELLPDYVGFSVALYDPDPTDPTGSSIQNPTTLTTTEVPDNPDNNTPQGIKPNTENSNPFFLTNSDNGNYSFLFDEARNQLDFGQAYILVVSPPDNSIYSDRRVKLTIGDRTENIVEYTATSLDGRPIRATDGQTTITGEIVLVEDAERVGLDLAVLDLATNVCDAREVQITKTGDRASAEPGDTVIYRLAIQNLASAPIDNLEITDTLPAGFKLEPDSVMAELEATTININTTQANRTITFTSDAVLEAGQVVNLIYAAQLNPNALRGDGRNTAIINAQRTDNNTSIQDGPAIHNLRIEPGIIEDTGILIGRVFVDKNFDGEQQPGEPGIPNAVVFLEDGNRIITDPDGLFSVTNILPGIHTGILDLTSIPEYRLAPNVRFIERNSKSRLVKLEPGGIVRMNFGVTPTAAGKKTESRRKIPIQPKLKPRIPKSQPINSDS